MKTRERENKNDKTITVVIVGASFAGSRVARLLRQHTASSSQGEHLDLEVVLLDSKPYWEYTPSSLRCLVQPDWANSTCFKHREDLVLTDKVVRIVCEEGEGKEEEETDTEGGDEDRRERKMVVLASGKKIPFHFCVIATGSTYPAPVKSFEQEEEEGEGGGDEHATTASMSDALERRKETFRSWRRKIDEASRVVILGGGSVGVELAGEIAGQFRGKKKVVLCSKSSRILSSSQMTEKASRYCHAWLEKRNVEIRLNQQELEDPMPNDLLFRCFGAKPNLQSFICPPGLRMSEKEGVEVSSTMQSVSHNSIFAVGDVARSSFEKTAFSADVQATVAARNIIRLSKRLLVRGKKGEEEDQRSNLETFPESMCHGSAHLPLVVIISLFKHSGSAQINQFVINGVLAAWMKRMVEHFQVHIFRQGKHERVWGFFERVTLFFASYCKVFGKAPSPSG